MKVRMIEVPYDSGHYGARMGAGPLRLVEGGIARRLEEQGARVRRSRIEVDLDFPTENTVAFEVARRLATAVREAREDGAFPLVLAGNCVSCLGTVAGLASGRTGVVWLDAHGDFNTPETSVSGFLDGMALSMLVGDCWRGGTASIPGFEPLDGASVLLVGARDLDSGERERLEVSEVGRLAVAETDDEEVVGRALDRVGEGAEALYLHLDLDVLDPGVARANPYAAPGGLDTERLVELIGRVEAAGPLAAAALTAYSPEVDRGGRAAAVAETAVERILGLS